MLRDLLLAAVFALCVPVAASAAGSDASDVAATVKKWVSDFNKGDMQQVIAACAPQTSVVDGFPPYAWPTCTDWINAYRENSKAIQLTGGRLSIGRASYTEFSGDRAYVIYPATFSDLEKGKRVVYQGTWTMTLQKTNARWLFTGSASAWPVH